MPRPSKMSHFCPHCGHALSKSDRTLWTHVDKNAPGGCWVWTGYVSKKEQRPLMQFEGRTRSVYRVAWELVHGAEPPTNSVIMHTCDNPRCVNPDHLRVGSQRENIADMMSKGRQPWAVRPGRSNGNFKFPADVVERAREMRDQGMLLKDIARETGMSVGHVHRMVTNKERRTG